MQLVEFKNQKGEVLRGLLDLNKNKTRGVVLIHGFERTSVEMKYKNLRDALEGKVNIWRFDFSGCGLSQGKFEDVTVEKMTGELEKAIKIFRNKATQLKEIVFVGHSLAGCVILNFLLRNKNLVSRVVLLGPALNQQELLKYYFVRTKMWKQKVNIGWNNYEQYFNPEEYARDLQIKKRMRKNHWLSNKYFLENQNRDYQSFFQSISLPPENFLIIHGDTDDKVPVLSNDNLPKGLKSIKVLKGDHDLEVPDMVSQYLNKTIKFIL